MLNRELDNKQTYIVEDIKDGQIFTFDDKLKMDD